MIRSLLSSHKQSILDRWSFLADAIFDLTDCGSSNTTYFARTPNRQFILKVYDPIASITQIQYEHSLLAFLQQVDLPFAVPAPIPTASGDTLTAIDVNGKLLQIAVFPKLTGQPVSRDNLDGAGTIGFALAELHQALAGFDPNGQLAQLPFWGNLAKIHWQIRDPLEIPQILNLGLEEQTRFRQILSEAIEAVPYLYATLPIQTIHADFITPNILMDNGRVSAVLDFEFATRDLRLLDYLASVNQIASFPQTDSRFEDLVRDFSAGYRDRIALTEREKDAAIVVWQLQRASALVYWTGGWLEGKTSRQKVVGAVVETLEFQTWLEANRERLLDCLGFA
jgi:Ser/Thr protein kinase RdoA (MazF antagonist)